VSAALVLLLSLILPDQGLFGLDICIFHRWTGMPCPGCGMTRAFCGISRGHLSQAWALHPLSFPLYAGALFSLVEPALPRGLRPELRERILGSTCLTLVAGLLVFGLVRIFHGYPWP